MAFRMYEMSSISTKKSHLPLRIFISVKGNASHGPRVKVSKLYGDKFGDGADMVTITAEDPVRVIGDTGQLRSYDLEAIKKFVERNRELLWLLWDEEITSDEFIDSMEVEDISNKSKDKF